MDWCLIVNDFQTPPKKRMNSVSFVHSFPLPWVFLQKHKIFYSHIQTDPAVLDHLSMFFSLVPPSRYDVIPPYHKVQLSHSHVHDTGSLSWTFAGLGKAADGAFFWLLPAVCCRGWKDLVGSQSLMQAELSTEGFGGWKLCDTEEP